MLAETVELLGVRTEVVAGGVVGGPVPAVLAAAAGRDRPPQPVRPRRDRGGEGVPGDLVPVDGPLPDWTWEPAGQTITGEAATSREAPMNADLGGRA